MGLPTAAVSNLAGGIGAGAGAEGEACELVGLRAGEEVMG